LIRQSFNNGYWITSLYEAKAARWFLVHGKHGSRSFPLYTRFTNRPNRVATAPLPGRTPLEDDLSNSAILTGEAVRIQKVDWDNSTEAKDPAIFLTDGRTCTPYATMGVVLDREAGRQAAILDVGPDAKGLLEEIVREKLPVRISGNRFPEDEPRDACVPELIWASER
jgi:hypothetical protein